MALFSETKVTQRDELEPTPAIYFEQAYTQALDNKTLPGYALIAGDKDGTILYSKADGVASLKASSNPNPPFQLDTICAIASMTKLLTSVACLQAVEAGIVELDASVAEILPEVGMYGIITGFDEEKNEGVFERCENAVTLRYVSRRNRPRSVRTQALFHACGQETTTVLAHVPTGTRDDRPIEIITTTNMRM
ncbi:beta-lactamase/transpeptidase-like protein [Massariosphaeria phaeospora]|uniref:Beta-lactamase/transpeptidase-like protein n=1 Tax=Massariosphaeria phaeospora TaxID=100035 RepID=A0A7C8M1M5_9PLEO|nr:beta-lactamase/transpeptidase-like protein [Massariosphaeria phaeospora]